MTIGQSIKFQRKLQGITQEELAKKLNVSKSAVGQYEKAVSNMGIETLSRIASALGVSIFQLYPLSSGLHIDSPMRKIEQIADYYEFRTQAQMMIEECSELTKAICKWNRKYEGSFKLESSDCPERAAIIEELADVIIMAKQLSYLLSAKYEVEQQIEFKLNRQLARMEEENADNESE